ncbi:integrase, catalytic region, zinc finger, CCHC-type containing protein [Tanacetum coccineum]
MACNRRSVHNGDHRFLRYIDTRPNGGRPNGSAFVKKKKRFPFDIETDGDEIYSTVDSSDRQLKKCGKAIETGYNTAKNANPLALVATCSNTLQDPYLPKASKPHKSYAPNIKSSTSNRSSCNYKYKGKEIAKLITPDHLITSRNSTNLPTYNPELPQTPETRMWILLQGGPVVQQSGIQCFNCKEFGHYAKECRKPKRVKDSTYHKEKMLLCKQAEKGVQLQAEQSDWLADTDEEIDEQELEAHYSYMAKIQEVPNADSGTDAEPLEQVHYDTDHNVFANDLQHFEQSESISNTCAVETDDSNVTPDSPDMCDNDIQDDQNDVECDDERVALANLFANLKLDVDENKKIQKKLKKANATLTQELTECKSILAETSRTLGEPNSIRDSCLVALQNKQTEFESFKAFNDRTVDYDKLERRLNETIRLLAQKEIDIKESLKVFGITDLMITKPINRNEERRNKRKQDMLKKETRSRLMLIEININVEDID